jgi:glutamyl-tRNA synthetase
MVKLRWMNGEYVKKMDFDRFYEMAEPYIKKVVTKDLDLKKIAAMVKTRIEIFPDIADHIDFFEALPEYPLDLYTNKKSKSNPEVALQILTDVLPLLEGQEDFTNDALFALLTAYGQEKGFKTGTVMWPIRIAISGRQMTPAGATEILDVLGKEESAARIRTGIDKLQNA